MTRFITGVEGSLYNNDVPKIVKDYGKQFGMVKMLYKEFKDNLKRSLKAKSVASNEEKVNNCLKLKKQILIENKKLVSQFNKINSKHGFLRKPRLNKMNKLVYRDTMSLHFSKLQLNIKNYVVRYNPMLKKEFNAHKQELLFRHTGDKKRLLTQKQSLLNRLERLDRIHNFKGSKSYIKPMTDDDYTKAVDFAKKSLKIVEDKLATA